MASVIYRTICWTAAVQQLSLHLRRCFWICTVTASWRLLDCMSNIFSGNRTNLPVLLQIPFRRGFCKFERLLHKQCSPNIDLKEPSGKQTGNLCLADVPVYTHMLLANSAPRIVLLLAVSISWMLLARKYLGLRVLFSVVWETPSAFPCAPWFHADSSELHLWRKPAI